MDRKFSFAVNSAILSLTMIKQTFSFTEKISHFFRILLPVFGAQISLEAIPFFGTVMAGQASPQDLVGVAVGSSLWVPVFVGLCAILSSIIPLVAYHLGAGRNEEITPTVMQGVYLALLLSAGVILLGYFAVPPALKWTSLEPKAYDAAFGYLKAIAFGVPFLFLYTALRSFMDGVGQTRQTLWVTLTVIPINGFFNWVLISGKLGFPALGGSGAGWAATLTYLCLFGFAVWMVRKRKAFQDYQVFSSWPKPSLAAFKEQLAIGLPIGFAIFCEVSIFCVVTFLMSGYGTTITAAHQAAMNFSGLLYMVPLSISMALTILVGYENGARRYLDARHYGNLGIGIAVVIALFFLAYLLIYNEQVASLYSSDPIVKNLTLEFLVYAKFFFLVDAIAAPIQGVLRGYKDVRVTFLLALFSYWVAGLPVGWFLATYTDMGPFGYWFGLVSGLTAGMIGLMWRLWIINKRQNQLIKKSMT